ncbi:MAG: cysteine desulfurase [Armatimonadota bacterium]|nr:cysteine desulfurase [Armatimonadota bacterium]
MPVVYFDNAASTKVDPRVLDAMLPFFCENYSNPSAPHGLAQEAKYAVEMAREQVATLLGADDPSEVVFTSCATEANNTVLGSFCGRLLHSAIEHPSVRSVAEATDRSEAIPVDQEGTIREDAYAEALARTKPGLVSIMSVNNEIGSIQDIDRLGQMAHDAGALFHSDITQGVGKTELNLAARPIDYATLSGHKFHSPKGIGVLWSRGGVPLKPFMCGGTHESLRRAGTHNVPLIVGLGAAAEIISNEGVGESERMRKLRAKLVHGITSKVKDVKVNGQPNGAPHIASFSFYRTEGEAILINLDARGVCCTAGSACSSGRGLGSPILNAIGLEQDWLRGTVRLSLSRFTTEDEVDYVVESLIAAVEDVRSLAGYANV